MGKKKQKTTRKNTNQKIRRIGGIVVLLMLCVPDCSNADGRNPAGETAAGTRYGASVF